ncbi:MAG: HD domain-containing phosphohydrolase [Bellilinea sp.]
MLIVIGTVGIVFAVSQTIINKQFLQLESQDIRRDAQRAQEAINKELDTLNKITENWALRNDTYRFIRGFDPGSVNSAPPDAELESLDIDVVLYFDDLQQLIYGHVHNPITGKQQTVPADLRELPQDHDLVQPDSQTTEAISGIVSTSQGLLILSSRSVRTSNVGSSPVGMLVLGRYIDQGFVDELGKLTQLSLDVKSVDDPAIPSDYQQAIRILQETPDQIAVQVPDELKLSNAAEYVAAYLSIKDLDGNPQLILRVNDERHLYQQGLKSVRNYGFVLILIGLICGGAAYLYFDRSLITRLLVIDDGINRFRETHNFDQQIEVEGNDELAHLASAVNATIIELGQFQEGQIEAERQFREALQNLSLAAVILDPNGRIVFCNDHIVSISGWQHKELIGHSWCARFIPEEQQVECRREIVEAARTGRITAHEDTLFLLRNGKSRTFTWSNTLLFSPDEIVTGIVRIGEDVTERRKAESLLRDSLRETRLHLSRLTALRNIDTTITSNMDTVAKLDSVLVTIQESLNVDAVDILRIDKDENSLVPIAAKGLSTDFLEVQPFLISDPVLTDLRENNEPLILVNPSKAQLPVWTKSRLNNSHWIDFYGAAPMISGDRLIGVLEVFARQPLEIDDGWLDHLKSLALQATITLENDEMIHGIQRANHELVQAYEGTLVGWARALELRDKETRGHSERMMDLTMHLGRRLGMDSQKLEVIARGVLLHDIGKMGVPDYILHKPGPLTDEEWVVMRQHPQFAYNLLKNIPYLEGALEVAFCHHERWDGKGYPRGLKGEDIPFSARIFSIIDVWDALTHDRPYRPAWPEEETLNYIRSQANTQFDPRVVEAFIKMQQDSILRQTAPLPIHFTLD